MYHNLPLADLVARARTLYTNARDTPEIATVLRDYGYATEPPAGEEATDYDRGLALVDTVNQAAADQDREYGEQYLATEAANAARSHLRALFSAHRRLGRAAVPRSTARYTALGLDGTAAIPNDALIAQAAAFYQALTDDPSLADGIRGLTPAAVADGQAAVEAARAAADTQTRETGDAQRATRTRDDAVRDLRTHAAELAAVAKVALTDRPQLREALGLLER